jgi:hypothetical protein
MKSLLLFARIIDVIFSHFDGSLCGFVGEQIPGQANACTAKQTELPLAKAFVNLTQHYNRIVALDPLG